MRLVNQARLKSIRRSTVYKYGFEVVRSHAHAMQLDAKNGNNKWKEAVNAELSQIVEYEMIEDKGKGAKSQKTINLYDVTLCSMSSMTVITKLDM